MGNTFTKSDGQVFQRSLAQARNQKKPRASSNWFAVESYIPVCGWGALDAASTWDNLIFKPDWPFVYQSLNAVFSQSDGVSVSMDIEFNQSSDFLVLGDDTPTGGASDSNYNPVITTIGTPDEIGYIGISSIVESTITKDSVHLGYWQDSGSTISGTFDLTLGNLITQSDWDGRKTQGLSFLDLVSLSDPGISNTVIRIRKTIPSPGYVIEAGYADLLCASAKGVGLFADNSNLKKNIMEPMTLNVLASQANSPYGLIPGVQVSQAVTGVTFGNVYGGVYSMKSMWQLRGLVPSGNLTGLLEQPYSLISQAVGFGSASFASGYSNPLLYPQLASFLPSDILSQYGLRGFKNPPA